MRGFIAGLIPSNDATTPNTKIDVGAGTATDSTNMRSMVCAAAVIDCTTVGPLGLDAGSLAVSTWYVLHAIMKADNAGTTSAFASLSLTPSFANAPGYVYYRPIGFFKTDASSHILPFVVEPDGETVVWGTTSPTADVSSSSYGTVGAVLTLPSVPTAVKVRPIMSVAGTVAPTMILSSLEGFFVPSAAFGTDPGYNVPVGGVVQLDNLFTNGGSLRFVGNTNSAQVTARVWGWHWDRGRGA
jgi:hypothetical protein